MDFKYSAQVRLLLPDIRAFIEEEVMPLEGRFLAEGFGSIELQLDDLRDEVKRQGWWLPHLSEKHGGLGLSLLEYGPISEELGRTFMGHYVFNAQAPDAGNMEILLEHGTPEQRATYLKPLLEGRVRSCFAMTEPARAGSNPTIMDTVAVRHGDAFHINGRKWFTTGADGASFAIVMAITDPEAPAYKRASQLIVPLPHPGYKHLRNISVMGEAGEGYSSHAEIAFDNCVVPQENVLGEVGEGFAIAQDRLGPGRIHHCMRWIGVCERVFGLVIEHVRSRELREGSSLGHAQLTRAWLAQTRAEIDAARLMVLRTAWHIDEAGAYHAKQDISTIKFLVAGVLNRVLDGAIQLHGALGVTDDTPIAYWYRHERAARIYDGPDEVHKMSVAKSILKKG